MEYSAFNQGSLGNHTSNNGSESGSLPTPSLPVTESRSQEDRYQQLQRPNMPSSAPTSNISPPAAKEIVNLATEHATSADIGHVQSTGKTAEVGKPVEVSRPPFPDVAPPYSEVTLLKALIQYHEENPGEPVAPPIPEPLINWYGMARFLIKSLPANRASEFKSNVFHEPEPERRPLGADLSDQFVPQITPGMGFREKINAPKVRERKLESHWEVAYFLRQEHKLEGCNHEANSDLSTKITVDQYGNYIFRARVQVRCLKTERKMTTFKYQVPNPVGLNRNTGIYERTNQHPTWNDVVSAVMKYPYNIPRPFAQARPSSAGPQRSSNPTRRPSLQPQAVTKFSSISRGNSQSGVQASSHRTMVQNLPSKLSVPPRAQNTSSSSLQNPARLGEQALLEWQKLQQEQIAKNKAHLEGGQYQAQHTTPSQANDIMQNKPQLNRQRILQPPPHQVQSEIRQGEYEGQPLTASTGGPNTDVHKRVLGHTVATPPYKSPYSPFPVHAVPGLGGIGVGSLFGDNATTSPASLKETPSHPPADTMKINNTSTANTGSNIPSTTTSGPGVTPTLTQGKKRKSDADRITESGLNIAGEDASAPATKRPKRVASSPKRKATGTDSRTPKRQKTDSVPNDMSEMQQTWDTSTPPKSFAYASSNSSIPRPVGAPRKYITEPIVPRTSTALYNNPTPAPSLTDAIEFTRRKYGEAKPLNAVFGTDRRAQLDATAMMEDGQDYIYSGQPSAYPQLNTGFPASASSQRFMNTQTSAGTSYLAHGRSLETGSGAAGIGGVGLGIQSNFHSSQRSGLLRPAPSYTSATIQQSYQPAGDPGSQQQQNPTYNFQQPITPHQGNSACFNPGRSITIEEFKNVEGAIQGRDLGPQSLNFTQEQPVGFSDYTQASIPIQRTGHGFPQQVNFPQQQIPQYGSDAITQMSQQNLQNMHDLQNMQSHQNLQNHQNLQSNQSQQSQQFLTQQQAQILNGFQQPQLQTWQGLAGNKVQMQRQMLQNAPNSQQFQLGRDVAPQASGVPMFQPQQQHGVPHNRHRQPTASAVGQMYLEEGILAAGGTQTPIRVQGRASGKMAGPPSSIPKRKLSSVPMERADSVGHPAHRGPVSKDGHTAQQHTSQYPTQSRGQPPLMHQNTMMHLNQSMGQSQPQTPSRNVPPENMFSTPTPQSHQYMNTAANYGFDMQAVAPSPNSFDVNGVSPTGQYSGTTGPHTINPYSMHQDHGASFQVASQETNIFSSAETPFTG